MTEKFDVPPKRKDTFESFTGKSKKIEHESENQAEHEKQQSSPENKAENQVKDNKNEGLDAENNVDSSEHLGEQLSEHLDEHLSEQVSSYLNTKSSTKAVSRAVKQLDEHLSEHLEKGNKTNDKDQKNSKNEEKEEKNEHLNEQLSEHLEKDNKIKEKKSIKKKKMKNEKKSKNEQLSEHLGEQLSEHLNENIFYWMSEKQIKLMNFLVQSKSTITRLKDISNSTGVPYGTLRRSIDKLISNRLILSKKHFRDGAFRGIKFELNNPLCDKFKTWQNSEQLSEHLSEQLSEHLNENSENEKNSLSSSSSSKETKTTSKNENFSEEKNKKINLSEIERILQSHPELGYWRNLNLTPRQTSHWIKIAGCSIDLMILYLSYCAFDMVENGQEKKLRKTPFDYFFRIIEKTGHYPKPKNYKSHERKKIEDQERMIAEKEKEIEKLKELNVREEEIQLEHEYQKMLQNKESEDYRWCFNNLNDFTKKLPETHSVFRTLMRKTFEDLQIVKQIRKILSANNEESHLLMEEYKQTYPKLVDKVLEERSSSKKENFENKNYDRL